MSDGATAGPDRSSMVRWPRVSLLGLGALVVNLVAFAVGSAVGASWVVGQPYPISALAVAGATAGAFALGGLVTWLLSRWRPQAQSVMAWAGLGLGLLSMITLVNAADVATGVALGSMHLVTAASWVVAVLPRRAK